MTTIHPAIKPICGRIFTKCAPSVVIRRIPSITGVSGRNADIFWSHSGIRNRGKKVPDRNIIGKTIEGNGVIEFGPKQLQFVPYGSINELMQVRTRYESGPIEELAQAIWPHLAFDPSDPLIYEFLCELRETVESVDKKLDSAEEARSALINSLGMAKASNWSEILFRLNVRLP